MKKEIKLIVLDLDGTLLNANDAVSEINRRALDAARKKGARITLASGRMFRSTLRYAERLSIDTPIITYNGALIKEPYPTGAELFHNPLSKEQAELILKIVAETSAEVQFFQNDTVYIEKSGPQVADYAEKKQVGLNYIDSFTELRPWKPTKILALSSDMGVLDYIKKQVVDLPGATAFKSWTTFCDIVAKNVDKGSSLMWLSRYLNIPSEQVMAIGDEENDIPMLKKAGIGVAMANATEAVKKAAAYQTRSAEENGVAAAIERFVL